jgi:HPt (histidine-containing phosphotransfer) domain-containing protein
LAHVPIVDVEALETLRRAQVLGEPDFVGELVEALTIEAPELLTQMECALRAYDANTLRRASHSLNSAAWGLGARRLRDVCAALELMASTGETAGAGPLVERAKHEYDQALVALNAEVLAGG